MVWLESWRQCITVELVCVLFLEGLAQLFRGEATYAFSPRVLPGPRTRKRYDLSLRRHRPIGKDFRFDRLTSWHQTKSARPQQRILSPLELLVLLPPVTAGRVDSTHPDSSFLE